MWEDDSKSISNPNKMQNAVSMNNLWYSWENLNTNWNAYQIYKVKNFQKNENNKEQSEFIHLEETKNDSKTTFRIFYKRKFK